MEGLSTLPRLPSEKVARAPKRVGVFIDVDTEPDPHPLLPAGRGVFILRFRTLAGFNSGDAAREISPKS